MVRNQKVYFDPFLLGAAAGWFGKKVIEAVQEGFESTRSKKDEEEERVSDTSSGATGPDSSGGDY